LATVMMPSGIPVATVALNGAKNAAVLAAEILAVTDERIAAVLHEKREAMATEIETKNAKLQAELSGH
ncbi:MAG: AIR carboxylase family protein, partial [Pygmaiobacter sp.]